MLYILQNSFAPCYFLFSIIVLLLAITTAQYSYGGSYTKKQNVTVVAESLKGELIYFNQYCIKPVAVIIHKDTSALTDTTKYQIVSDVSSVVSKCLPISARTLIVSATWSLGTICYTALRWNRYSVTYKAIGCLREVVFSGITAALTALYFLTKDIKGKIEQEYPFEAPDALIKLLGNIPQDVQYRCSTIQHHNLNSYISDGSQGVTNLVTKKWELAQTVPLFYGPCVATKATRDILS